MTGSTMGNTENTENTENVESSWSVGSPGRAETVEFDVPPDFVPFEPADDVDDAYELVLARLGSAAEGLPPARRQALTELYAAGSAALADAGAIWSGTCVGTIGDRLSTATLTVTALDTEDDTPQATVAAGLVEVLAPPAALRAARPLLVRRFDAPAGPAVITLEQQPGWQLGAGGSVPLLSAKAYLPMPPALRGVLLLELGTPDVDNWPEVYAPLLVRIVRSVRFRLPPADPPSPPPPAPATGAGTAARHDPFGTRLN
ncbi:hypothetical protein [Kitasatospora fiedleri]|uniref:hypothetical protein n=1 Tax=Kitasatospora fiedleri TaxID=2991545 RepID=UPI00249A2F94|nr:hypothetical protein [Kitasatospora fiedleri]